MLLHVIEKSCGDPKMLLHVIEKSCGDTKMLLHVIAFILVTLEFQ
jgi:hypothetical protein